MTTATSELPPGYRLDELGAWVTIPWPTDPLEKMTLVASSLGPGLIDWAEGRTDEPGLVDYLTGLPWRYTDGQKRFLILFYAYNEQGRWTYRSGVKRGAKGTGKDPFGASICDIELAGPSQLVWEEEAERWTGMRHMLPLVQIASNSEAQSKDVLRVANAMFNAEARDYYRIDCGETRTILKDGGRLEVLTASEKSSEGDPATFIMLNEALALDTPVPTPSGWTTVGELQVGDTILSPDGLPTRVLKTTEVYRNRPCYRVTFRDGDSIVADAGHLWAAKRSGYPAHANPLKVLTTEAMYESGRRYKVPTTEPIKLPEADLPIDPYVLGAWLGDGHKNKLAFTTSVADLPWWLEEFARLGVPVRHLPNRTRPGAEEFTIAGEPHDWGNRGVGARAALVALGIYANKRIPPQYLRGSADQRLAFLQGLVDTDGCVDTKGRVIFCNTNENLADGVAELARSLGHVVQVSVRQDTRKASYLPVWRVEWQGDADLPSARMPRKRLRLKPVTVRQRESRWQYIASIEPVDSVPVKCVGVDSADHLFLAGNWKTTHNTHHMTSSSGGHHVAAVARRNVAKSPRALQARVCEFTNAHQNGQDSVAQRSYEAWQNQVAGRIRALNGRVDILYDSIEADPGVKLHIREQLLRGLEQAYQDAEWADLERLVDEIQGDTRTTEAEAIRYYLNGLATAEDAWVDPRKFDDLAQPEIVVADGEQIAMFLDCSKSEDATALSGARISDGHVFTLGLWQREHGDRGKGWLAPREKVDATVRAQFDRYQVVWFGVDPSPARDDSDESLYWMPLVDTWHRVYGGKLPLWATPGAQGHAVKFDMRLSQRGGAERNRLFTEQAELTAKAIDDDGTLTHDGHAGLRMHVHNARRRPNQWGVSLSKENRDSTSLVDLAVTMVGALLGRRLTLNSGKLPKKRTGRATFV